MIRKALFALTVAAGALGAAPAPTRLDVTVSEGTSMSVGVSPDGRTLAIDMQGSIWTLPVVRRRGQADHRSLQRRAPADLVARRQVDHLLRLPRRRLRHLGDRAGRIESAQADVGTVRRSRTDLVARRHPRRLLVRSRRSARQRLQHLDAGRPQRRAETADEGSRRRFHAVVVARRQGDRVRVGAGEPAGGMGRHRRHRRRAKSDDGRRARRRAVVRAGRTARVPRDAWRGRGARRRWSRTRWWCAAADGSRYEIGGKPITGSENVFAFRASFGPGGFYYVSDGKIHKRSADGGSVEVVPFTATMTGDAGRDDVHAAEARLHIRRRRGRCSASSSRRSRPTARRSRLPPSATSTSCRSAANRST